VERLKRDMHTYREKLSAALAEKSDVAEAPAHVVIFKIPQIDAISEAQAFLRGRVADVKLTAPVRRGRSKGPIVYITCKKEF
jgi:hypothetical protein